jgi:hypothetical protein
VGDKSLRALAAIAIIVGLASLSAVAYREHRQQIRFGELQSKIQLLEQDNAELRETADFYYKRGIDLFSSGDFQGATDAFGAVVSKFPASSLVEAARQRIVEVDVAHGKAVADVVAKEAKEKQEKEHEEASRREEQEKQDREQGEPIDYSIFYAKALSTGLPIGKRFRFMVLIYHDLLMDERSGGGKIIKGQAAFDGEAQYERFLQGENPTTHEIVASMGDNGMVQVHRIE